MQQHHWQHRLHFSDLSISAGSLAADTTTPLKTEDQETEGLKLVILLRGEICYETAFAPAKQLKGPFCHLLRNDLPLIVQHQYSLRQPMQYVSIRLPLAENQHFFAHSIDPLLQKQRDYLVNDGLVSAEILQLSRQILALDPQHPLDQLQIPAKGLDILYRFLQQQGLKPTGLSAQLQQQLEVAAQHIQQHIQHPFTLKQLAQYVGLNPNKLSFAFQQYFGCSVYDYLTQQRIAKARCLLAQSHMPISEIAWQCGLSDSHFSKFCKQHLGMKPLQLRSRH
ncbi:helix-turn-helix transcriptional regulator [Acinetobacter larvae]|uniref:HTH araC/xylS-type domain-containing protein n=1 Tax=Acinetobacter larvae TaxID=1789224 RepID=A0A1B2LY10_9GAMM|nr:AraC family transcriptional regulator [Acinetobacter larvae]AOA57830.1 hypothetical protein BFG52_05330 [Acinetobacter larvae]